MLDSQDIKTYKQKLQYSVMNPVRELYTSALGAKMFVGVGGNSTEEMMFHLRYKQCRTVWRKTF